MRVLIAILTATLGIATARAQVPPLPESAPPPADESAQPPVAQPSQPAAPEAPPPIVEDRPAAQLSPSTKPEHTPTLDNFKQTLSPHGRWVTTPEHGDVFVPSVDSNWRPYTNGRWVYTEYGWTFVSYDTWGWGPHHYGRWLYYPEQGWSWIPGYEWAPSWVTWRYGDDYIGWAPLGPYGIGYGYYGYPSLWCFTRGRGFYGRLGRGSFIPTSRVPGIFGRTRFAGVPRRGRYFSPPARYISRLTGRNVRQIPAGRVAPSWVGKNASFRPRDAVRSAMRGGHVATTSRGGYRGGAYGHGRNAGVYRGGGTGYYRRGGHYRGYGGAGYRYRHPSGAYQRPGGYGAYRGGGHRGGYRGGGYSRPSGRSGYSRPSGGGYSRPSYSGGSSRPSSSSGSRGGGRGRR